VAVLINTVMLTEHPHFRNVVRDAVPFVAVKMADVQGDQTLQHIEAFLEEASIAPREEACAQFNIPVHVLALQCAGRGRMQRQQLSAADGRRT
jgi:hypothetical protein